MRRQRVEVELLRAVDHDIATGVMTTQGWASDEWPAIYPRVLASHILVIAGPIWLGDNSSHHAGGRAFYSLSGNLRGRPVVRMRSTRRRRR